MGNVYNRNKPRNGAKEISLKNVKNGTVAISKSRPAAAAQMRLAPFPKQKKAPARGDRNRLTHIASVGRRYFTQKPSSGRGTESTKKKNDVKAIPPLGLAGATN